MLRDNVKLSNQLNQCVAANMELKILNDQASVNIEKTNAEVRRLNEFMDTNYPEIWKEFNAEKKER